MFAPKVFALYSRRYGAILDRPTYDTPVPVLKKTHDLNQSIRFEPFYRVLLHYSMWNDNKLVAKTVAKAVPIISFNDGLRVAEAAEKVGSAIVVTVPLEDAEIYDDRLRHAGLKSSIESA